jgi:hypothetical protein
MTGSEEVYSPQTVVSKRLGGMGGVRKGMAPVAIRTGYIDRYDAAKSRKQVIIVVREDWTVTCYSADLEVLWERGISHQKAHDLDNILDKYEMVEASILATSLSNGTVFVGTRVRLNDETATNVRIEGVNGMRQNGDKEHPDMRSRSNLEHFGVHALDAHTGKIVWMHDGTEHPSEDFSKTLPLHAFRSEALDLVRQIHHTVKGNDWRVFKNSLLVELPHVWNGLYDSTFRLAHFVRKHIGAHAGTQKSAKVLLKGPVKVDPKEALKVGSKKPLGKLVSGAGRFLGIEAPPLPETAVLPHDASEHTDHPNVLVAHTRYGLEIFALKDGDSITSISLPEGRVSGDIDGDGVIDTVLVLENDDDVQSHGSSFAHVGKQLQRCTIMAVSGLPPTVQLFNGSLCTTRRSLNDGLDSISDRKSPAVSATAPLLLREHDPASLAEAKYKSVCAAVHTGILSCYSGKTGDLTFQTMKHPTWKIGFNYAALLSFVPDAKLSDASGNHDDISSVMLLVGDSELALVSRDGSTLASAAVPYPPNGRTIIGDFNNDGVNDVIIMSSDSLFAYSVRVSASTRGMLIAMLVLVFLAVVVFVANIRTEVINDPKLGKRSILSVARSTDDFHID